MQHKACTKMDHHVIPFIFQQWQPEYDRQISIMPIYVIGSYRELIYGNATWHSRFRNVCEAPFLDK
jgi:hypothetical protein